MAMAKNTTSTLNPFAIPYHKLPEFISNNPHFHPPSSSHSKYNNLSVHTPVPRGPRLSRSPPHRRRKHEQKPTANNKSNVIRGFQRRNRWKNRRGHYAGLLPMDSETTSVMIKNIPNKYTKELLIQALDDHCKVDNQKFINESETEFYSAYDSLYLPIDFKRRKNAGFAFVNFTNPKAALRFKEAFDGKHWTLSESRKVVQISKAKIQGKEAIINFFKKMEFTGGLDEDMPVLFEPARDGFGRFDSKMITMGKN